MADSVTGVSKDMRLGEEKILRVAAKDIDSQADMSTATATFELWDSTGSQTVAPTSASISGTTRIVLSYFLTSGAGKVVTAAGTYRITWRLTFGSEIREYQQQLTIKARPS